jgi:hypothetical protein
MNKIIAFGLLFILMITSVAATVVPTTQPVRVDAKGPGSESGVLVTLEYFNGASWVTMTPSDTTDTNGKTMDWYLFKDTKVRVQSAFLEGGVCESGADTEITMKNGQNTIRIDCELDNEVPEFGVVAAGLALVGAVGGMIVFRRN